MKKLNVQTPSTDETSPCPPCPFGLNAAREQINQTDKEIVNLLEKRFNIVMEIGEYKRENNLPILDEEREKRVVKCCIGYLDVTNGKKSSYYRYSRQRKKVQPHRSKK